MDPRTQSIDSKYFWELNNRSATAVKWKGRELVRVPRGGELTCQLCHRPQQKVAAIRPLDQPQAPKLSELGGIWDAGAGFGQPMVALTVHVPRLGHEAGACHWSELWA